LKVVSALTQLAIHGGVVPIYHLVIANANFEVELHEAIKDNIPSLIQLLEGGQSCAQSTASSLLIKLADHGEFVAVCYPVIANASVKSSFAKQLRRPFYHSLCS
jgi:hypothetical protein